jgi:hypothetical protein
MLSWNIYQKQDQFISLIGLEVKEWINCEYGGNYNKQIE